MGGYGGLIELVLVFALVLGWGLYELWSVRRANRKAQDAAVEKSVAAEDR